MRVFKYLGIDDWIYSLHIINNRNMIHAINVGEAATELADKKIRENYTRLFQSTNENKLPTDDDLDTMMVVEVSEEEVKYNEKTQELFNEFYGDFENLLMKCKA